ncbi:hypothetical protein GCM10012275_54170 [Longimycelium tulufanense]|uniref:TrwC relaxase domain-containing protein n=2 Tax=Longimycelium tulufanense TaxID=907463 RepID=A0A8J3CDA1_9PSEU|nr:hypothetical protein GCM10012275_54170 [Longimycelium tulufanense]
MTPGGYEYLVGRTACADEPLAPGQSLADYYTAHGYPAGEWIGEGARQLGVSGAVTAEQMTALFGEGRNPNADAIEARMIAEGTSVDDALRATQLGRRFPQYEATAEIRRRVLSAYRDHNTGHGRPVGAPIPESERAAIRARVQAEVFAAHHEGRAPADEKELRGWLASERAEVRTAVSGYELVFAPPKSVSVLWALAEPDVARQILHAHQQAVRDTVTWLEDNACYTRAGDQGQAQVDMDGICGAMFVHWDSRTGDPHLHTHVPISAKVRRTFDGTWTTLDGRTLLHATVTASEHYNNRLRDLLRDMGARWVPRPADGIDPKRPILELDGVPLDLIKTFSQRSAQIEAERARRIVDFRAATGREPTPVELVELGRRAQYDTRAGKQPPRSLADHRRGWREFIDSVIGQTQRESLAATVFGHREELSPVDIATLAKQTVAAVAEERATFTRLNLEAAAHRQTEELHVGGDQRQTLVAAVVETVLADPDTVCLHPPAVVEEPHGLTETRRCLNNEGVFTPHHGIRYTTIATLRAEEDLVAAAREHGGHRVPEALVRSAIATSRASLNPGQRALVTEFATSCRRLQLALAPAGTGKTTAMRVLARAWRASGARVYAFGPSARAAQELGAAIGARPHTLHQVTTALEAGVEDRAFPFTGGDLVLVDEAGMAGTHTLHRVVAYALERGADVRLVGDDCQLAAVEAGGAIRLLAQETGALTLTEVVRFRDPDQAVASLRIRDGAPEGLDYYVDRGWVHDGSIETLRARAHAAWRADLDAGTETLLIVGSHENVVALNLEARALRVRRREVAPAGVVLHDGTPAGIGDWIVTRHNDRRLGVFGARDFVKNGDRWRILEHQRSGALRVQNMASGATVTLPANYVAENVELAYAATINRCQGMNVTGNSHGVIPEGATREQLYTMLTRAQGANHLYVPTVHHVADPDFHTETPPEASARGVLEGMLARSSQELSATEQLRTALAEAESLPTLVAYYDYAAERLSTPRYEWLVRGRLPHVLDADAFPALLQTLRNAEDAGWQAEHLLAVVAAHGRLEGVDDPAAVLVHRIEQHVEQHARPPRDIEPHPAQVQHWQQLVGDALAGVRVDGPSWQAVWRLAAGGVSEGLDVNTALQTAASKTGATGPWHGRLLAPQLVAAMAAGELVTQLDAQRATGRDDVVPLPWLPRHPYAASRPPTSFRDSGLQDLLDRANDAIAARVAELRETVAREQPAWAAPVGPRPTDPDHAARWDRAVELAAAYRELYRVTSVTAPVGAPPDQNQPSRRHRAYQAAQKAWSAAVAPPVSATTAGTSPPVGATASARTSTGPMASASSAAAAHTRSSTSRAGRASTSSASAGSRGTGGPGATTASAPTAAARPRPGTPSPPPPTTARSTPMTGNTASPGTHRQDPARLPTLLEQVRRFTERRGAEAGQHDPHAHAAPTGDAERRAEDYRRRHGEGSHLGL